MSKNIWCKRTEDGGVEFVEFDPKAPRREVNAPYVKIDSMPPVMSQTGSGKIYDSKKALRAEYKRMGFEEIGVDIPKHVPIEEIHEYVPSLMGPRERKLPANYEEKLQADVARAIEDVRYNQAPLTEYDRHRCKIINEQIAKSPDVRVRDDAKKL